MRRIHISEITGEEVLAQAIIDESGRILLSKGIHIKSSYLNKLFEAGVTTVYIEDEISEGIEISSMISESTEVQAKVVIKDEVDRFYKRQEINIFNIQDIGKKIIDEILDNQGNLINISDIRIKDEFIFTHSINVCILSLYLAQKMGIATDKLKSLALGCLLHDIGKIIIPKEILIKEKPTNREIEEIKKHIHYGYKALETEITISPIAKMIVLMHHEKEDGTGYLKIKEDKVHECVKIASICNAFDNVNTKRKDIFLNTSKAIRYLQNNTKIYFNEQFVKEFLKHIPLYPVGSIVLLNNGTVAIVVKNNIEDLMRPVVRLLYNAKTRIKYMNYEIDLSKQGRMVVENEILFNKKEYESITKTQ
ncbi:MAG: HD-GYP domain-containing protein [Clostridia bacterium]